MAEEAENAESEGENRSRVVLQQTLSLLLPCSAVPRDLCHAVRQACGMMNVQQHQLVVNGGCRGALRFRGDMAVLGEVSRGVCPPNHSCLESLPTINSWRW